MKATDLEHCRSILTEHVTREFPSKSWLVAKPGTSTYSFSITWSPGMLAMHGDIDVMVVEHYSFNSWENAARWVHNADISYFCEKSTARRDHFNDKETVKYMIERGYEALRSGETVEDNIYWKALQALFGDWGHELDDLARSSARRRELCRMARLGSADHTPEEYYTALSDAGDDEPYIAMEYPHQALLQYAAFQFWAKGIVHELDAQNASRPKTAIDDIKSIIG